MRKRKRLNEEALLLKENEARFCKRPEYGTHEYFEWVGLLYGMPPTGSIPELNDSSDEQEDWEEGTKSDKRGPSQGAILQEVPVTVSEQPFVVGHRQASLGPPQLTSRNNSKDWLKTTVADVYNGTIAPPKKDVKELHEQELQLKMKKMELITELLKINTDQMKLKNWYVIQAGQIDPLPTDVLLEEGAKFVNELRVRAIKEGRLVNKHQSLNGEAIVEYALDENGENELVDGFRSLWIDFDHCGLISITVDGFRSLWMDFDHCGWISITVDGFRSLWMDFDHCEWISIIRMFRYL
uniref:Uncharacterized protein n=1 Tax=Parascaris equorum TaxID=6256 RepID=A0A914SFI9_PAREQ